MLRAGGSAYAYDLYKKAGIDMAAPAPYRALAARMNRLMDEVEALEKAPDKSPGKGDAKAERLTADSAEDWFPHPSPDGKKLVYIAYPAGTPTHNPRTVQIEIKLVAVNHDNRQRPREANRTEHHRRGRNRH